MEKLLIIFCLAGILCFFYNEWKLIQKQEAFDAEVERFRYMENMNQKEITLELLSMSTKDKESLLHVLLYKSKLTQNNARLAEFVQYLIKDDLKTVN